MLRFASLIRFLRSRRLAVGLILGLSAWSVIASSVPGWGASFSGPVFFGLALWLCAATAACAWERSSRALRWRVILGSARSRPLASSVAEATARLRSIGLKTRTDGEVTIAYRPGVTLAVWASPAFHWALAAGMILGLVGSVVSTHTGVALWPGRPQPVAAGSTTMELRLLDVRPNLVVEGIERGQSPKVRITTASGKVLQAWVYPNRPLKFGSTTVHAVDSGPSVRVAVSGPDGSSVETDVALATNEEATAPFGAALGVQGGPAFQITQEPGRKISVQADSGEPVTIGEGESGEFESGYGITFAEAGTWATVNVVRDPTAVWLVLASLIAGLAVAVALLYPARCVRIEPTADGCMARIMSARIDPAFSRRVMRVLEDAESGG